MELPSGPERRYRSYVTMQERGDGQGRPSAGGLRTLCGLALLLCGLSATACYEGPGPKEPPPGSPGGFCAPGDLCNEMNVLCDPDGNYCYDKFNVCRGFFCGEHGTCSAVDGKPSCTCEPGYTNEVYSLYCEPLGS